MPEKDRGKLLSDVEKAKKFLFLPFWSDKKKVEEELLSSPKMAGSTLGILFFLGGGERRLVPVC